MIIKDTKPEIDKLTTDLEIILNLWLGCNNKKGQEIYKKRYKEKADWITELLQMDYELGTEVHNERL